MRSILYYIISKLKKLQNKNSEIVSDISGIKQNISDLGSDINSINSDIGDVKDDIANMIDSGESNGINYVKLSDGTLIQYGQTTVQASTSRSAGGLSYFSGNVDQSLPVSFLNMDYKITVSIPIANLNYFSQAYALVNSVDSIGVKYLCTNENDQRNINWIAIGKWK